MQETFVSLVGLQPGAVASAYLILCEEFGANVGHVVLLPSSDARSAGAADRLRLWLQQRNPRVKVDIFEVETAEEVRRAAAHTASEDGAIVVSVGPGRGIQLWPLLDALPADRTKKLYVALNRAWLRQPDGTEYDAAVLGPTAGELFALAGLSEDHVVSGAISEDFAALLKRNNLEGPAQTWGRLIGAGFGDARIFSAVRATAGRLEAILYDQDVPVDAHAERKPSAVEVAFRNARRALTSFGVQATLVSTSDLQRHRMGRFRALQQGGFISISETRLANGLTSLRALLEGRVVGGENRVAFAPPARSAKVMNTVLISSLGRDPAATLQALASHEYEMAVLVGTPMQWAAADERVDFGERICRMESDPSARGLTTALLTWLQDNPPKHVLADVTPGTMAMRVGIRDAVHTYGGGVWWQEGEREVVTNGVLEKPLKGPDVPQLATLCGGKLKQKELSRVPSEDDSSLRRALGQRAGNLFWHGIPGVGKRAGFPRLGNEEDKDWRGRLFERIVSLRLYDRLQVGARAGLEREVWRNFVFTVDEHSDRWEVDIALKVGSRVLVAECKFGELTQERLIAEATKHKERTMLCFGRYALPVMVVGALRQGVACALAGIPVWTWEQVWANGRAEEIVTMIEQEFGDRWARVEQGDSHGADDVLDAAAKAGGVGELLSSLLRDANGRSIRMKMGAARRALMERPLVNRLEAKAVGDLLKSARAHNSIRGNPLLLAVLNQLEEEFERAVTRIPEIMAGSFVVPLVAPRPLDSAYATLWRLDVVEHDGAGGTRALLSKDLLEHDKAGGDAAFAFQQGCEEARSILVDELGSDPSLVARVRSLDFTGTLVGLKGRVDGPSLALAAALSTYSAVTGLHAPDDVAATGRVNLQGGVSSVGSLEEKYRACLLAGMSRFLAPAKDSARGPWPTSDVGGGTRTVESVRDAINVLWQGRKPVILVSERYREARRRAIEIMPTTVDTGREYVLVLTCISGSDPFGFAPVAEREMADFVYAEPGGAITLAREYRPQMMACIVTAGLRPRYLETVRILNQGDDQPSLPTTGAVIERFELSMDVLPDPSEPHAVMTNLRRIVGNVLEIAGKRASAAGKSLRVVANVSSGTPQMQYALQRLSLEYSEVAWTLVQVRRSVHVTDGGRRVREVQVPQ